MPFWDSFLVMMFGFFIAFTYGLIFGSFASVLIYRSVFEKRFTLGGRSYCPHCHHRLGPLDLIPLLSFLMAKGRCRYCSKPISWLYPLLELTFGLSFGLVYVWWSTLLPFGLSGLDIVSNALVGDVPALYLLLVFAFTLVSIFFLQCLFYTDLLYYALPDRLTLPAIGVVLIFRVILAFTNGLLINAGAITALNPSLITLSLLAQTQAIVWSVFWSNILFAFAYGGFFALFYLLSKGRAMGDGDMRLGFLLGLILGYEKGVVGFIVSFLVGGVVAAGMLLLRRKRVGQVLPLGPFLIFGTVVAYFWADSLANWYLQFLYRFV